MQIRKIYIFEQYTVLMRGMFDMNVTKQSKFRLGFFFVVAPYTHGKSGGDRFPDATTPPDRYFLRKQCYL